MLRVVGGNKVSRCSGDSYLNKGGNIREFSGEKKGGKPIGQILKEKGLIDERVVEFALKEQMAVKKKLGEILVMLGFVTDYDVAKVLAEQSGLPFMDIRGIRADEEALKLINSKMAKRLEIFPLVYCGNSLKVAIADPFNIETVRFLKNLSHDINVEVYIAPASDVRQKIETQYFLMEQKVQERVEELIRKLENDDVEYDIEELVDNLLILAINERATDMHFVASEHTVRVYFRIDGILDLYFVFPKKIHQKLINYIKVRSDMDISEKRKPQDGSFTFYFLNEKYNLRVSTSVSVYGESVVVRILQTQSVVRALDSLGFYKDEIVVIKRMFERPYGLILLSGPTGSGKTTTLYSALKFCDILKKNVMTIEDPVEYKMPLIRQTQINRSVGYTFAEAIRNFLRQDPDVILVGEIRDEETAQMAIRAALTGHLVLSTVHTNDCISSVMRLTDLGIENSVLASCFLGVVSQRLVRKICPYCKTEIPPNSLHKEYGLPLDRKYYKGRGCEMCRDTGYIGRTVIPEVMPFTKNMRKMLMEGHGLAEIQNEARKYGFRTLLENGLRRVMDGVTTIEEVKRVVF